MQFFLDTANINEIKELSSTGLVDGVTTNPSLIAKEGKDFLKTIEEICNIVQGPVSAEVAATDFKTMVEEGRHLSEIAQNVVVKIPLTEDGLKACRTLSDEGKMVNVTLCFSPLQALMAAKAGATFVSPFVGRLDDIGQDGTELLSQIISIYDNYPDIETMVLAASLRHVKHILEAATIGVDVVTLPPKVMHQLIKHPLTEKGLDTFLKDWKTSKQTILGK